MRAREADHEGYAVHDGVKIFYEVFGEGDVTILLVHGWQLCHSRVWKAQIPYLSRRYRVVSFDLPGNGRSDRPSEQEAYAPEAHLGWITAVLDATETERAILIALSSGVADAVVAGGVMPERVDGLVLLGSAIPLSDPAPWWEDPDPAGLGRDTLVNDYETFLRRFYARMLPEAHSTKHIEDATAWACESDGATMMTAREGLRNGLDTDGLRDRFDPVIDAIACPVLVIHGTADGITPLQWGEALARRLGADLLVVEGGGHVCMARDPVKINRAIRAFVDRVKPPAPKLERWTRAHDRRKRALFVSSPIGLGHAQRDVAIARELRRLHPDLDIQWLAQDPVTRVLDASGETIHPASRHLVSESRHMESESAEHDLHCFQAYRRMDEILVANFHVFDDVVSEESFDLWIGDEAWDVDFFLHDNPERKHAAFCWLTDFVGWLPMPQGGESEARITADYNAEMIEQVERYGRIRDRSLFVGDPDDIVPEAFGPDLPMIRDWTERHFQFAGYVTGFDPAEFTDRAALRHELGYRDDEAVCVVTVGGSGVGEALLRKVIAAYPEAKDRVPALRMVVVAGPRIDPRSLPTHQGLEIRPYVHELYRHLAACDLAVVQGGLTTSMELTANGRPFLYFPLAEHFEQNFHVHHRLQRYGAGRRMDYATTTPDMIAAAIADDIGREVDYLPVDAGGAARAAAVIAEML